MRILNIWDSEYPWDVRLEKVLRTETEAGHDVHLVARNRLRRPVRETIDQVTIHRLAPWTFLGRRLDALSQFPAFPNPRWVAQIGRVAAETEAEAILVRDLPLAPTAIHVGARLKLPVALDMAENYPAMLQAIWDHGLQAPLDFVVRNPRFARRLENWTLRRVDHVFVVVEESRDRLLRLGIEADRITVVCNTPLPERIPPEISEPATLPDGALRLVYLGLMEVPRGIGVVLDAVRSLKSQGMRVQVDLIGAGRDQALFMKKVTDLDIGEEVKFHGFVPYDEALAMVGNADVGLVPHIPDEAWDTTIPNKLFDYMAIGLPVISSDPLPAARIVTETGCGVVYRGRVADDLVGCIRDMSDRGLRREAGRAGRTAILERYNWNVDGRRLLTGIKSLVA